MKKIIALFVCCFTLFCLLGCDVATGTWKFHSKTAEVWGFSKTFNIGDKDLIGNDITEDYLVVIFNKDGTGTLTQSYADVNLTFTWVEEDDVIKVTGQLVSFDAKIEDGYLIFDYIGETYKLKK